MNFGGFYISRFSRVRASVTKVRSAPEQNWSNWRTWHTVGSDDDDNDDDDNDDDDEDQEEEELYGIL